MECKRSNKQYVGNFGTVFNLHLKNHRYYFKNSNVILAYTSFKNQGHNFNKYSEFIVKNKLAKYSNVTLEQ